jgi:hypothetical protein
MVGRATAQINPICAPQPMVSQEPHAEQNGGYARGLPQRLDHVL